MDLTSQVSMQYCCLQHLIWLPSPVTSTTGCVFALPPSLHSFWNCFSTDIRYYIRHLLICRVHLSVSYSLPFHTVHGVLKARILKWFAFSFSSGPHFVRTLHHDPFVLGGPHGMAHSFIKLDKAVVHVIRLVSFLCLWFLDCLTTDREGLEHFLCCRLFQCEYQESISDS